ncbi:MAG: hypothetical protein E7557_01475 [Ruminococcaceae bacterium]|nr:hypothetical protein [Oscillospiraceae bacterium]
MFKNPKTMIILFVVAIIAIFAFFPSFVGNEKEIKDTNGPDDFSLCELTDEDIIEGIDGDLVESHQEGSSTHSFYGKLFTGAETIYNFENPQASYTINLSKLKVTEGNIRVVVVIDNKIVYDFEPNKNSQSYTITGFTENASLRVAGESAFFDIEFKIN